MKSKNIIIPFISISIISFMFYYLPSPWAEHEKRQLIPARPFIVASLSQLPPVQDKSSALVLGTDVGHEILMLLEKGYEVTAVDVNNGNLGFVRNRPEIYKYRAHLITKLSSYSYLDFSKLPTFQVVVANNSIPYMEAEFFRLFWRDLVQNLPSGAYFIGNIFDPSHTSIKEGYRASNLNFHSQKNAMELFKDFEIIDFRELNNPSDLPGENVHFYDVFARKK